MDNWPVITDSNYINAKVNYELTEKKSKEIMNLLDQGIIPVLCGFLGRDETGNITTLGRGGSDITAFLMDVRGCCEFTLMDPDIVDDNYVKISELESDLARVNVIGMVSKLPREIKDESGRVYLVLVKLIDDTGSVTLELWDDNIPKEKIKKGSIVEVINGFTKIYNGELRLGLRKDGKIEIIRGS